MPRSPWLAIDATESPSALARALRRAWERFIRGGRLDGVRMPVADSWRRSLLAGVQPQGGQLPAIVVDGNAVRARWEGHPLAQSTALVRDCLADVGDDSHLFALSDADGVLLAVEADARISRLAADLNFVAGALWNESAAGTNAVGTALVTDHAVQIFAAEHFKEAAHDWICSAAPVHDPETGALLGTVGLAGPLPTAQPHTLAVAAAMAQGLETDLRGRLADGHGRLRSPHWRRAAATAGRDEPVGLSGPPAVAERVAREEAVVVPPRAGNGAARHRPRIALRLLGRDRAEVEIDGRAIELPLRCSEILALLWAHPPGVTGECLATELYGDAGRPGTVRVEIHRLRKLLGPWIESGPYRLTIDVHCDVTEVTSRLELGAVRNAAESYSGPLLPRSEAPGVVNERDALERWLRHAVMTADDDEALWAWTQSESGREDLPAWKRLLSQLGFHDPRRTLAAARVSSLRDAYCVPRSVAVAGRQH